MTVEINDSVEEDKCKVLSDIRTKNEKRNKKIIETSVQEIYHLNERCLYEHKIKTFTYQHIFSGLEIISPK